MTYVINTLSWSGVGFDFDSQHNVRLGAGGEAAAAARYVHDGYDVVAANWRCERGEIDLVVARERHLVFVEVKTRSSDRFGSAVEAVDKRKQRQVRMLAAIFLRTECRRPPRSVRFDVAACYPSDHGYRVEVFEEAF